ncbi:hypothetical protein JHK85_052669 [Glycine max]|nr:hypothetical protein JHK85_052669 [Glycine max]
MANTNPQHLTSSELHPNFLKKALKIAGKTEKLIDSSFDVQENLDDGDCFSLDWVANESCELEANVLNGAICVEGSKNVDMVGDGWVGRLGLRNICRLLVANIAASTGAISGEEIVKYESPQPRSTDPLVIGGVIGDVLEPFTSSVSMGIVYNNCPQVINCCELKPSKILNRPRIEIGGDDLRTFYTLVMVDPDAPSPGNPTQREYLH